MPAKVLIFVAVLLPKNTRADREIASDSVTTPCRTDAHSFFAGAPTNPLYQRRERLRIGVSGLEMFA